MAAGVRASASATAAASRGPWRFKTLRMARRVVGSCCSGDSGAARLGRCSRQDEVDVAELVPQIPLGQRGGVGRLEQLAPGDGLEHGEM